MLSKFCFISLQFIKSIHPLLSCLCNNGLAFIKSLLGEVLLVQASISFHY